MGRLQKMLMLAGLLLLGSAAAAAEPDTPVFVTLGTAGGPVPNPLRSQPANAFVAGDDVIIFDSGDGTVGRLAAAGLRLGQVRAVFLSHLHLDHTAGLGGIIGLRWMNNISGPFRVYGPPGTRALVDGIVASMDPAREAGFGLASGLGSHEVHVDVTEIDGNAPIQALATVQVLAVENSHYSPSSGSSAAGESKSFSFRINGPGRSIVYTGDTGPSEAVAELARGADLLVSEVQDLPALQSLIRRQAPDMPAPLFDQLVEHLRLHHISPEEVGRMAAAAGVGKVVLTHLGPGLPPAEAEALFVPSVSAHYRGPVTVARDLQRH